MKLSDEERAMLDGHHGEALRRSMEGLVQLGEAFGAEDMVRIGYGHVHPGMALYAHDVELLEELVRLGAKVFVSTSANVTNVDSDNWKLAGAPEKLVRVHRRGVRAHTELGCASAMTCTPHWAGHWPTWNMHITSIESGVTVFCNSVLGARSNRDGFFSVYAAIAGRYPRFGYHLDETGSVHIWYGSRWRWRTPATSPASAFTSERSWEPRCRSSPDLPGGRPSTSWTALVPSSPPRVASRCSSFRRSHRRSRPLSQRSRDARRSRTWSCGNPTSTPCMTASTMPRRVSEWTPYTSAARMPHSRR
jgi:hypothetical protein